MPVRAILDGPRFEGDPLEDMFRLLEPESFYSRPPFFQACPALLNPSPAKVVYAQRFKDFWSGSGEMGVLNLDMAIIGYSLPRHDDYARQALYRLITNYQQNNWGEPIFDHGIKSPLRIIDLRKESTGQDALRSAYSFVDWSRCDPYFHGFDLSALELLHHDRVAG